MNKHKNMLAIIAFLILVLFAWMAFFFIPQPQVSDLFQTEWGYNLIGKDFTNTVYIGAKNWESWPERFYYPADFIKEVIAEAPVFLTDNDYKNIQYATHRLTLNLPAEQLYAIDIRSSDYSMRLFIDGDEIGSVGVPRDSRESTVPRVLEKIYYFIAKSETITLTVHTANFVHGKAGCQPPVFTIGTPENVGMLATKKTAFGFAVAGCLITAALYHLGLFLINRKRKNALYLSACCGLFVIMTKVPVFIFFPDYNFFFWIRVEYLVHIFTFLALTLFIKSLFPLVYNKWGLRIFHGIISVYAILILITDTVFFTGLLVYFEIASVLIILYTIISLAAALRGGSIKNFLAFIGVLAVSLPGLSDIVFYRSVNISSRFLGQYFITPIGMMFFIFCYAMVVSLEYAETEKREQSLTADNAALDRVNQLKTDLMRTISHETLTPLAVMMGFAEITAKDARKSGLSGEFIDNLNTIADEARRLAALMEEMRQLALTREYQKYRRAIDVGSVIQKIAGLYTKVLERKGTRLELNISDALPPVYGNENELVQVIFNLLRNSDNHTENGTVTIRAEHTPGIIQVTVTDTGCGITSELLPRIFERGVSGSKDGSGYGLAICRDIITAYGGEIYIKSGKGTGTEAVFTLPIYKEGKFRK